MCRNLFSSPIPRDSLWLEIPIDRCKFKNTLEFELAAEVLIVPKKGYYINEICKNMPHIPKSLKARIPQNTRCQQILKKKRYPLMFMSDN